MHEQAEEALSLMTHSETFHAGVNQLRSLPRESVIVELVHALRAHPAYQSREGAHRYQAYQLLIELSAQDHPVGRDQLIRGLFDQSETDLRSICADALATAAPDREIASALDSAIDQAIHDQEDYFLSTILRALGKHGVQAASSLDRIKSLFNNPDFPTRDVRAAAAYAMLGIDGIQSSIENFKRARPGGDEGAVFGLLIFCREVDTIEQCVGDASALSKIHGYLTEVIHDGKSRDAREWPCKGD